MSTQLTPIEGSAYERIRNNLEELGMEKMAAMSAELMAMVAEGRITMAEAMLRMTDAQVGDVRESDLWKRVGKANFPYLKTLDDFDFSFQPSIDREVIENLATMAFVERCENIVLVGSPGVGKTHIAVALGIEAVRARKLTYFVDCQDLIADLRRAQEKGTLDRRMRYFAHLSLLVIDELGYLEIGDDGARLMFQLISKRYERRSTIITTNVSIGQWGGVFGNPVTAAAIADRICHHCTVIPITGRSWRMKDLALAPEGGREDATRKEVAAR